MKKYTSKQIEKTIDIYTFEVQAAIELLNEQKEKLFPELAKDIKIPGFRPGKAPRQVIEEKLATKLFTESINRMLPSIAYEVIIENSLNPITNLEYSLKDFDESKGITFTFSFTNYPEVTLADYSKIKIAKKEVVVKDDEIESVMQNIIKSSLPKEKWEKNIVKKPEKSSQQSVKKQETSNKQGEHDHKGHSHAKKDDEEIKITNDLVEALGYETEKTVEDLKKSIKEKLVEMKTSQNQQDYIDEVIKEAVAISKFDIPKVFVEREIEIMENNFKKRLEDIKLNLDTYLASQGSTIEEYRKDWAKQAEERVKTDLILLTIASNEKLIPKDSEVETEIKSITDPSLKAQYDNANGRDYIKTVMTKQNGLKKLMEIVEGNKKADKAVTKSGKKK